MKRTFIALRPRFLTFKNSWFGKTEEPLARGVRLGILITGALFVPYLIFIGIQQSITELEGTEASLGSILEIINVTFLSVLFFSSCVHALNSLFLSKDNEMLISSPLSPSRLFAGKFSEVVIASSWVLLIFYLPAVWAVGSAFDNHFFFHITAILYVIPLVIVPCSLSLIASILFVRIYPARRVRELLIILSIFLVIGLHFGLRGHEMVLKTIGQDLSSITDATSIKTITRSITEKSLLLLSKPFELASAGKYQKVIETLFAAFSIAAISLVAAYRCFQDLYLNVFSLDTISSLQNQARRKPRFLMRHIPLVSPITRAFSVKDYKIFLRDLSQPVQLILFLLMGIFAVMGFRASAHVGITMRQTYAWWDDFLMCANIGFHIMLSILFAGRFIFPSIAAEGEASWMIKSAPLRADRFFRAKLLVTAAPSILILTCFLAAGCIMSGLGLRSLCIAICIGFLNAFCISAISIGLGAYFSNMRYEHLGQITTGIGSVLSMFISLIVVPFDNLAALCIAVVFKANAPWASDLLIFFIIVTILASLHHLWIRYFLAQGQKRWVLTD